MRRLLALLGVSALILVAIAGASNVTGTNGPDTISTGSGDDTVVSLGSNDVVHTDGGNDYVDLGQGNDQLWLGNGDDYGFGSIGSDTMRGEGGRVDRLYGNAGNDVLYDQDGYVTGLLDGGDGNDTCYIDWIPGEAQDNTWDCETIVKRAIR